MTASNPVLIEVPGTWDRVPAGEFVPLRLVVHRPADQLGPVIIPYIRFRDEQRVAMNTDLFQSDVELQPGESCSLTVGVRFNTPGPANLSDFLLQVNPVLARSDSERQLVPLPGRPVLVIPSLARQVTVQPPVRICGYNQGVKLEITVQHVGQTAWEDFEISVGPPEQIQAGLTCHRRPKFERGRDEKITFDIVTTGAAIDFTLAGTAGAERVEDRRSLPVPTEDAKPAGWQPFTFLEPRSLTTDRITVRLANGGPELPTDKGIIDVWGKQQYAVTIYPSHPQAEDIDLAGAPGRAEVEELKSEGRAWSFLVTIVDDPWWTQLVRLYYDVQTPANGVLRGELYLSIHPSSAKLWAIAGTAGAAMTIQGLRAMIPAVFSLEGISGVGDLLQRQWTDWLMVFSIPLFRIGLWALDRIVRLFYYG